MITGIIAAAIDVDGSHTRASFSIVDGKLRPEGWGGHVEDARRIAGFLREAADDLEKNATSWVEWNTENKARRAEEQK